VKGLCDSQRLRESLNPTVKGIPTEKAWDNKLWPKSHHQRDSHWKGLIQQQVVG
jgi:hypothetical protein